MRRSPRQTSLTTTKSSSPVAATLKPSRKSRTSTASTPWQCSTRLPRRHYSSASKSPRREANLPGEVMAHCPPRRKVLRSRPRRSRRARTRRRAVESAMIRTTRNISLKNDVLFPRSCRRSFYRRPLQVIIHRSQPLKGKITSTCAMINQKNS